MQRLRSTFKRSRTPTGAEMKSQSSLEVPKQVRSASFDEIQLEAKRQDDRAKEREKSGSRTITAASSSSSSCSSSRSPVPQLHETGGAVSRRLATLRVPQLQSGQRSKSFDACGSDNGGRRAANAFFASPVSQVSGCYHCSCVKEYARLYGPKEGSPARASGEEEGTGDERETLEVEELEVEQLEYGEEDEDDDDDDDDYEEEEDTDEVKRSDDEDDRSNGSRRDQSPEIRVTLTPTEVGIPAPEVVEASEARDEEGAFANGGQRQRRRSIASPRLSRQEALTSFPAELPAIFSSKEDEEEEEEEEEIELEESGAVKEEKSKLVVRDIFLTVPELKRDRAASVDSCFNNKADKGSNQDSLTVPQQGIRSKSVDIVLPTDAQTRYTTLLPANEQQSALRGGREEGGPSGSQREPRSTPDWGPGAINGEHLWVPTAASGDFCYVNDCSKHGARLKCAACRVVAHVCCAGTLGFACKPSFRDVGVRQYREQTSTHHHWVHRRSQKGKCANCSKSFQSKLSFSSKEIVALSCSWCKAAYHNKEACFNIQKIGENCELGTHASIIVPPSWIVKLPRKGSFKSSLRKSPRKKKSGGGTPGASSRRKSKEKDKEKDDKDQVKLWVVKPIPTATVKPVLVFINPKSGGNQGAKLLQKFQWLLNPRQVFDLTQGGPKMGLELFKKVPNLRILACGGDGTVGWVLSILDQIGVFPPPAVGVLPLGTGNDLARALGWGGGYTDEPIAKILTNIGESDTTLLDRWQLAVERNPDVSNDDDAGKGKDNLPLNVVNNYFSLGVDAHIALEFHEAREAHPEKFNSRLRNKMFYGQMGGKDLVRRKWKDLSEFVSLDCDGQDLTPKLKEHRVHAIVFLNIASYGGGTHPWGAASGSKEPSTEDGLIEVVGLTTYQLPLLQAGGHGTCIAQCSKAKLVTTRTIPMQVDGEACRLLPSVITLSLLNQATMLAKRRTTGKPSQSVGMKLERLKLPVMKIKMSDYEAHHSDKERLKRAAISWLPEPLDLDATLDLESLRAILAKDHPMETCCFLDSCTAERFFRIDRAQEQLHYVTDVAAEALYVLEENSPPSQVSGDLLAAGNSNQEMDVAQRLSSTDDPARTSPTATTEERPRTAETSEPVPRKRSEKLADRGPEIVPRSVDEETAKSSDHVEEQSKRNDDLNENGVQLKSSRSQSSSKSAALMTAGQSQQHAPLTFISSRDRLFGLSAEVHSFSSTLLEKTCDGILKAAKTGDLQALKELHGRGYSLLSIDASGQTALHLASRHGHKDLVRYLIACAPPTILNMVDNDKGQTALHKAAQQKRRSICCMLVAGGATLTVRDRHGNTPRQLALIAEDRDLAAYLHSQEQFQLVTEDTESVL